MTINEFKRQVISFLRKEEDFIQERNKILISIDLNTIELSLKKGANNEIICIENGNEFAADEWILHRLGKVDILANAILDQIPEDKNYVSVACQFESLGVQQDFDDTTSALIKKIDNRFDFATNVFYITAEAGEGKTWLMNQTARLQAQNYLKKRTNWILLPIMLSGRPFLRLDEIIIGTLANTYRFNSYYIESCLELIKQGHIVLGLDGFEEMFIQGEEGDIVSSLGSLLNRLDSSGTLVFSTRRAYYKYTKLENQAKLFDSFGPCDVDFSTFNLNKWDKQQFVKLMLKSGFVDTEANQCYDDLSKALTPSHPILTRAFLARKLIDEISEQNGNVSLIVEKFKNGNKSEIIQQFVSMLIVREANRWIRRDDVKTPLLTEGQHEYLLQFIAEEMWRNSTETIRKDTLLSLTELACSELKLTPNQIAQCKERILHHALLSPNGNGYHYSFCHDEFYAYFLGRFIGNFLINTSDKYVVRRLLDKKLLPELSIEEACEIILKSNSRDSIVIKIQEFSTDIIKTSCFSQNLATILLRLLSDKQTPTVISGVYCSVSAISGLKLCDITFENCIIEEIFINPNLIKNITFRNTEIIEATIDKTVTEEYVNITFDQQSYPHSLKIYTESKDICYSYNPSDIQKIFEGLLHIEAPSNYTPEEKKVIVFYKLVNSFLERTGINENLLKTKLGVNWSFFESNILQPILRCGILVKTEYRGQDRQNRYKLNLPMETLIDARKNCHGNFDELLTLLKSKTNSNKD